MIEMRGRNKSPAAHTFDHRLQEIASPNSSHILGWKITMVPAGLIGVPFLGACLLIGIRLIRKGTRGERVGTSPHCRACGYDLTDP